MESFRERKKAETRQHIADTATPMFIERGFDAVTVAEIADAAGVSKVTVFNYFPRKEDILLDRLPEGMDLLTLAVRSRGTGESPLSAIHHLLVDLAGREHPLGGFRDRYLPFWRTLLASPALRARLREAAEEYECHLADLFAEAGAPDSRLAAAVTIAAIRAAYIPAVARVLAGEPAREVHPDYLTALARGFDLLRRAFDDTPDAAIAEGADQPDPG